MELESSSAVDKATDNTILKDWSAYNTPPTSRKGLERVSAIVLDKEEVNRTIEGPSGHLSLKPVDRVSNDLRGSRSP